MASVEILIHLSNTAVGDVHTINVTTASGTVNFSPAQPTGSGAFSTTHAAPAPGVYAVVVEVPSAPVAFPGPVDDPKQPSKQ